MTARHHRLGHFLIPVVSEVLQGTHVSVAARPTNAGHQARQKSFSRKEDGVRAARTGETGKPGNIPGVP